MARVVCITSGLTGILHAGFELITRLEVDGHEVVYASPKDIGAQVEAQGISYNQLPPINTLPEPPLPPELEHAKKWKRWMYKIQRLSIRQEQSIKNIRYPEIMAYLRKQTPDILIIDVELHEYVFGAYAENIPFVLLSQWFSLWESPGLPYLLTDIIPGEGWRGHPLMIRLSWWIVKWQRFWMFTKKRWYSVGTDRRTALLNLAKRIDFPLHYIKENFWPGPFSYQHFPVLSMTAKEMEFPHRMRANLHYVGPMVHLKRKDTRIKSHNYQALAEVLRCKAGAVERPLIYCSVSSMQRGDEAFIKKVCQAVAKEPSWIMIVGLGGKLETSSLGELPKNVFPFSWVPQLEVLARADCSINHGGIHTINECLHFKVPMLVYSGKHADQNGCAARVAYHRLGLMGDKDVDEVADIHQKIKTVLSSEVFRGQMDKMHQYYLSYRKEKKLEQLIEQVLNLQKP